MLHSLISLKMAAMVAALGLDTAEWSKASPDMVAHVQALADAQAAAAKGEQPPAGKTLQETINKIKELADKGDKDAQFSMGLFLQQSNAQGALQQALDYYKRAADQDQLQAMNNWGFLVAASTQDQATAKQGIEQIKKAADKGLNAARRNMATIYLRGMAGEKQDIAEAKKLLEAAATGGDNQAEFELAQFYLGAGGPENQDDDKAWEYLNSASKNGNPNALAALGSVLFDGKEFGVKKKKIPADQAQAVKLFKQLADQGNGAGLRTMGELHEKGLAGVAKDFTKALEFYAKAAQANDSVAQVMLAGYYDRGHDADGDGKAEVAQNAAAALELYRMAAQNNVALAVYNIGTFYEAGRSVDRDLNKAFTFFLQSAVAGFPYGMQKTGVFYLNGAGTTKDPVAAAGWFARGSLAGLPDSHLSLGILRENGVGAEGGPNSSPFQEASGSYMAAADADNASDPVRMEALLRVGSLYLRGLMVPVGQQAKPDFERAYIYFRLASEIDPKNELAASAKEQAEKQLTQDQKSKAGTTIEKMKADREARRARAAAEAGGAAPAAAPAPPAAPATPEPTKKKK